MSLERALERYIKEYAEEKQEIKELENTSLPEHLRLGKMGEDLASEYLINNALEFFDFLFMNKDKISCTPHPGQNHEQYALPKNNDRRNIKTKAIKLALIIPL